MRGWLLIETLRALLVANAIVWFVIAQGWPKLLRLRTLAAAGRMWALDHRFRGRPTALLA